MNEGDPHECPEGLRITDGPRYTLRQRAWGPGQKFYKVQDLDTNQIFYLTAYESAFKVGVKLSTFKWNLKNNKTQFNNRWEVQRIPRFVFIEKTGRTHKVIRDYFYRY